MKFYVLAVEAYKKGDYRHAVDMYKVSASWAYEPAEYNLGVMYFQGMGVSENRPLGTAWMFLAAQRNKPHYVAARHMMVESLSDEERFEALRLLEQLEPTYGDKVALRRAKAQWIRVGREATGSHLGHGMGELGVGNTTPGGATRSAVTGMGKAGAGVTDVSGAMLLSGGSVDGSAAYQQFSESDNPYASKFKLPTGTATVGPLQEIEPGAEDQSSGNTGTTRQPSSSAKPPSGT